MAPNVTLEIEECIHIHDRGLLLVLRDFASVNPSPNLPDFADVVVLIAPDGATKSHEAQFRLEHFTLAMSEGRLGGRFSIVAFLPGLTKRVFPIVSKIRIDQVTLERLREMAGSPP